MTRGVISWYELESYIYDEGVIIAGSAKHSSCYKLGEIVNPVMRVNSVKSLEANECNAILNDTQPYM